MTKKQLTLAEARSAANKADIMVAKEDVKWAKFIKKHGSANMVGVREIYGRNITENELTSIQMLEAKRSISKAKVNKILKISGTIAIPLLATTAIAKGKHFMDNGKFGFPVINFVDGKVAIKIK